MFLTLRKPLLLYNFIFKYSFSFLREVKNNLNYSTFSVLCFRWWFEMLNDILTITIFLIRDCCSAELHVTVRSRGHQDGGPSGVPGWGIRGSAALQDGGAWIWAASLPASQNNSSGPAVPWRLLRARELLWDDELQVHGGPGQWIWRKAERVLPQLQHQNRRPGTHTQPITCRGGWGEASRWRVSKNFSVTLPEYIM